MLCSVASSTAIPLGLTVKATSLGPGADLTLGLGERANLRAGLNYLDTDVEVDLGDSEVDVALDLQTVPIFLDWHPGAGGFRISAGAVFNDSEPSMSVGPDSVLLLDAGDFPVTSLTGTISFDGVGYYLGIGYGNAVGKDGRLHFAFDLGILYLGDVDITATAVSEDASLQPFLDLALEDEIRELEDDIGDYPFYPLLSFGLSYRF